MKLLTYAVDVVANLAPWLAPLPTAWLVADRTTMHLGWPLAVGWIAGATLELLGVAIMATALDLWSYQRDKRKSDPDAPLILAWALVGLYLVAALLLVVMLDLLDGLTTWAQAVFPILSVAAFAVVGLRYDHRRRVDAIAVQKAVARRKRKERKEQPNVTPVQVDATTKTEIVRRLAADKPGWTRLQLAQEADCSLSTVSRALNNGTKGE